jgi:hypothetical protein
MTVIVNKKQEERSKIHKAANTAADYLAAWRDFLAIQTHSNAREVIKLGEQTLEEQNQTGLSMLNPTHVKHRILIADQYLKDTPEETTPNITKGWLRHPDGKLEYVGKFTKVKK